MEKGAKKGVVRRIIGDLLIALTALLTIDVVVVMERKISTVVLKDTYRNIFHYELVLCIILLLFSLDVRFGFWTKLKWKVAKLCGWIFRCVVILLSAAILYFCARVNVGMVITSSGSTEYALVLGMALENGKPTKDLISRIEVAKKFLDKNPNSVLILTGGNPDDSGRTEAVVMKELLLERGASGDKLILEDQAATTKDNFVNAAKLVDPSSPVFLITSNYHMDRAVTMAKKAGFTNIKRLPAPAAFLSFGSNMLWEVILDFNEIGK